MVAKPQAVYHLYTQSVDSVVVVNLLWYKYDPVAFLALASRSAPAPCCLLRYLTHPHLCTTRTPNCLGFLGWHVCLWDQELLQSLALSRLEPELGGDGECRAAYWLNDMPQGVGSNRGDGFCDLVRWGVTGVSIAAGALEDSVEVVHVPTGVTMYGTASGIIIAGAAIWAASPAGASWGSV